MKSRLLALLLVLCAPADLLAQTVTYTPSLKRVLSDLPGQPVVRLRDGRVMGFPLPYYAQIYDPATDTVVEFANFPVFDFNAAALQGQDGNVWITGGGNGQTSSNRVLWITPGVGGDLSTPLNVARSHHAMTGLPDGRMLVIGGQVSSTTATSSIEIGTISGVNLATFKVFGALSVPRSRLTATMDRNGRIIVIGGLGSSNAASAAIDIIDPASGTVIAGPPLSTARYDHRVVTLADGRLLVMGGKNFLGQETASVEIVTPTAASVTVSAAPSMITNRAQHSAIALPDGRVFVTGGTANSAHASEFYTLTGTTPAAGLVPGDSRYGHTAVLLADGSIFIAGGEARDGIDSIHSVFDPAGNGVLAELHSINDARYGFSAVSPSLANRNQEAGVAAISDGRVVVLGAGAPIEAFDPATGTTSPLPNGIAPNPFTATPLSTAVPLSGNRILVLGAGTASPFTAANEMVTVHSTIFTALDVTGARESRSRASAALLPDGRVLVVGGFRNTNPITPVSSVEVVNTQSLTFSTIATTGVAGYGASITVTDAGRVFVIGGLPNDVASGNVIEFHPASNTFTQVATLKMPRYWHSATAVGNRYIAVVGGIGEEGMQGHTGTIEIVDVVAGTSTMLPGGLLQPRAFHSALMQGDGTLVVAGGTAGTTVLSSVEQYDLVSASSQLLGPMRQARMRPLLVVSNGALLVASSTGQSTAIVEKSGTVPEHQTTTALQAQTNALAVAAQDASDTVARYDSWFRELHVAASAGAHLGTGAPLSIDRPGAFGTSLADGRVLVAGGGSGNTQRGVEMFDPATGAWTVRPLALTVTRVSGTATPMDDGRVLIQSATSAEVFNPAATSAPFSSAVLGGGTARALGASLKIAGGRVLLATGASGVLNDLYDPRLNRLLPAGAMMTARASRGHLHADANGVPLIIGGSTTSPLIERWVDRSGEIQGRLSQAVTGNVTTWQIAGLPAGAVIAKGAILYVNGLSTTATVATTVVASGSGAASVVTNTTTTPSLPFNTAVSFVNDTTASPGGVTASGATVIALLNGLMPNFTFAAGERFALTVASGSYVVTLTADITTNANGSAINVPIEPSPVEFSNPALTLVWTQPAGNLAFPRANAAAERMADGRILITGGSGNFFPLAGGASSVSVHSSEILDPVTIKSSVVSSRPTYPLSSHDATLLLDGRIVITGQDVDVFDPTTGEHRLGAISNLTTTRGNPIVARLPDGRVLIAGGLFKGVEIFSDGISYTDLETRVTTLSATIATLETEVATLEGQLVQFPGQIATLQAQVTAVQAQLAAANAQVVSLQGQLAAANSANTTLQGENTALIDQVNGLQTQINQQNTQIANLQSQLALAANDIALRDQTITTQAGTIAARDLTITALNTANAGLTLQVGDLNNLNSTLAAENIALTQQLAAANLIIAERDATIAAHVATIAQLNADKAALTQQLADETAANNALTSSLNDANAANATLTGQVASLQADLAAANQAIAQRDATIATHVVTIAQLTADKASLAQQLADETAAKAAVQAQLASAQVDLVAANQTIAQRDSTIAQQQTTIAALTGDNSALQTSLDAANASIASLTSEVGTLTSANAALVGEVNSLATQLGAANTTIASLNTQVTTLAGEKTALQGQLVALTAEMADTQAQLISAQGALATANQTIAARDTTIAQQQATLTSLSADKTALQASLNAANTSIATLTSDKTAMQTQLTAASQSIATLTAQKTVLEAQIASLQQQLLQQPATVIAQFVTSLQNVLAGAGFVIPGITPADQLTSLVNGIANMPPGSRQQLLKELGGKPGNGKK